MNIRVMSVKKRKEYLSAINSLYANHNQIESSTWNKNEIELKTPIKKVKRKKNNEEEKEHIALVTWLKLKKIRCNSSPNGGSRNLFEAMKFKRMGVSPGYPDVHIPYSKGKYHNLFIEMKKVDGGVVSDAQKDWIDFLNETGSFAFVCQGAIVAKELVDKYFEQKLNKSKCCNVDFEVNTDRFKSYFVCSKCKNNCDVF